MDISKKARHDLLMIASVSNESAFSASSSLLFSQIPEGGSSIERPISFCPTLLLESCDDEPLAADVVILGRGGGVEWIDSVARLESTIRKASPLADGRRM